jgi:hypothetical protein
MTEPEYASFDDEAVSQVLEAARQHYAESDVRAATEIATADSGGLEMRAQCISITSSNHKVCVNLPLGLGSICIPLPFNVPNGTAVRACLSIRTTWGIPTGVCVTLYVGGEQIVRKCFP